MSTAEELRETADDLEILYGDEEGPAGDIALLRKAAAELDRLRARVDELESKLSVQDAEIGWLHYELGVEYPQ